VAAQGLQPQRQIGDPLCRQLLAAAPLADVPVLTEDAAQVAHPEEDRSAAVPAAQAVLLAEVREGGGDDGEAPRAARPPLVAEAVRTTVARTRPAVGELAKRFLELPVEEPMLPGFDIDRLERVEHQPAVRRRKASRRGAHAGTLPDRGGALRPGGGG